MTHVDDFNIAGTKVFMEEVMNKLREKLKVSKVEKNKFRFTGVDIAKTEKGITISMEDYAASMNYVEEIRDVKGDELLTRTELLLYRKMTGKLSWLASNTRPDLAITALLMSRNNSKATIKDLKKVNKVIDKIRAKPNKVEFVRIGERESLSISGITDASHKMDDKSISGNLVLLGSKENLTVVPLFWKSKTIQKVCHSAKGAETRSMMKLMEDSQFFAQQVEQLLFGRYMKKIPLNLFSDSKPLLESIGSTHQIDDRLLRSSISDMKDSLYGGEVTSFSWLDGETCMVSDCLTKECKPNEDLEEIIWRSRFRNNFSRKNLVRCSDGEIRVWNKCNKDNTRIRENMAAH